MAEEAKPKRVLTEAQRLAFLKGREKRMANIEKKRLEKLEMEGQVDTQVETKTSSKQEETKKPDSPPPRPANPPQVIPDDFADQIASKVAEKIKPVTPPPVKKRKYTKRVKAPVQSPIPERPQLVQEPPPRPAFKFSWM